MSAKPLLMSFFPSGDTGSGPKYSPKNAFVNTADVTSPTYEEITGLELLCKRSIADT